jgi:hypothetical protein
VTRTRTGLGSILLLGLVGIVVTGPSGLPGCTPSAEAAVVVEAEVNEPRVGNWARRDKRYTVKMSVYTVPAHPLLIRWRVNGVGSDDHHDASRWVRTEKDVPFGSRVIVQAQRKQYGGYILCTIEENGVPVAAEQRNDAGDCKVAWTVGSEG